MKQVDYTRPLLLKIFLHLHFVKGVRPKKNLEAIGTCNSPLQYFKIHSLNYWRYTGL